MRNTGTSDSEFTYMEGMPHIPNPYQQEYDTDDASNKDPYQSEFPMSRNPSSTSLRTRSATNGSAISAAHPNARPRYAGTDPTIALHTQFPGSGNMSPGDRNVSSYFSPTTETPSTRSSSQSAGFSFSRQNTNSTTQSSVWNEDTLRYTAPALSRVTSRDGTTSGGYFPPQPIPRGAQRPSLPPLSASQSHANGMAQRMRSASSPDIHHHSNNPESRRYMGVHTMQTVDNVPVPPIPAHMANMITPVNRSQNGSPTNTQLPIRTQPQLHTTHFNEPEYNDTRNSGQISDPATSPLTQEPEEGDYMPTQLKAKVNFEDNYVTLVIATNIMFRSLTDRVDAKLARFTDRSIGSKSVRLRYRDEDGDFVTIDSDEAVQLAFLEWREQHRDMLAKGLVGEIELYCQVVD